MKKTNYAEKTEFKIFVITNLHYSLYKTHMRAFYFLVQLYLLSFLSSQGNPSSTCF